MILVVAPASVLCSLAPPNSPGSVLIPVSEEETEVQRGQVTGPR